MPTRSGHPKGLPSLDERVRHARDKCSAQGLKLTAQRERVYRALIAAARPVKAYDLLSELQGEMPGLVPMTVYRALEFLIAAGLVHKLAATSSYLACTADGSHPHPEVAFLICQRCGHVDEVDGHALSARLLEARAAGQHFVAQSIEINGVCGSCSKEGAAALGPVEAVPETGVEPVRPFARGGGF